MNYFKKLIHYDRYFIMIDTIYKLLSLLRYEKIKAKKDYTKGKNIYVSGYPISGNSWISFLISYILNCKFYNIDATEWSNSHGLSQERLSLKKYLPIMNALHKSDSNINKKS